MLIIDAHLDLAWNALQGNRNLLHCATTIRTTENRLSGHGRHLGTVGFPDMRRGHIALSVVTVFARSTGHPVPNMDFATHHQSYAIARGQLAYYRALEREGIVRVIVDTPSLDAHMGEWTTWEEASADVDATPPLGLVISMEGADPIADPSHLQEWWNDGLRFIGLTHYGPGRYAGGTGTELGLTTLGVELLAEMERIGVVLDLTHCSDQSFGEALERYGGPVLASHNNCRELVPHQRQFTDAQIRAIIERDGVVGAAFDAWMLQPDWVIGETKNTDVTLATVVDHIDHVCQLAGNARHAAIGTDLDGGFGREQSPRDLDTIADLQKLSALLEERGYGAKDVEAILHGNWLRLLRRVWNK